MFESMPLKLLSFSITLLLACSTQVSGPRFDPALDGLEVASLSPQTIVPHSVLVVRGESFVGAPWGTPHLVLKGSFDNGSERYLVDFELLATFVDLQTLSIPIDNIFLDRLGSNSGTFEGTVRVDIDSSVDGARHSSEDLSVTIRLEQRLTPVIETLVDEGPLFVNDWLQIGGDGFLLGGNEGSTFAVIEGCFESKESEDCIETKPLELEVSAISEMHRKSLKFAFSPDIAGIRPGLFRGQLTLRNRHANGETLDSASLSVVYDLNKTAVFDLGQDTVSLGQYLTVSGAGFVKNAGDSSTLLEVIAQFTPDDGRPIDIDLIIVPEVMEGRLLRYTINEDDALGQQIGPRYAHGTLSGELRPITAMDSQSVRGEALAFRVDFAPVKQVLHLKFTNQYVEALRAYGLRAMDAEIRQRIAANVLRDFRGINVEVRLSPPQDFSLYSVVEIGGPDPNALGLLGYDNTPGKDTGNNRLHDHIGGVNASTQEDGYPGYGGVFIESLFIFSKHPPWSAGNNRIASDLFDEIFDPVRPDRSGAPVRAADLYGGFVLPATSATCPGSSRQQRIGCATLTLANLVSSTLSHEVGHSLGLANPEGGDSHYLSDGPRRIMDAGSNRPFTERAELEGDGPAEFCVAAYQYLRTILPTTEPQDLANRPGCR